MSEAVAVSGDITPSDPVGTYDRQAETYNGYPYYKRTGSLYAWYVYYGDLYGDLDFRWRLASSLGGSPSFLWIGGTEIAGDYRGENEGQGTAVVAEPPAEVGSTPIYYSVGQG